MNTARIWRFVLACFAIVAIWSAARPIEAQAQAGCTCPAGYTLVGTATCQRTIVQGRPALTVPAVCPVPYGGQASLIAGIGHLASTQQQLSFWGINQMLQQKRDQFQGQTATAPSSVKISGYASTSSDGSVAAGAQQGNPLASRIYDTTTAPAAPNAVNGAWVQGLGDWEHDDALNINDAARMSRTYAAQGGVDRTWQSLLSSDDALVAGIVSSWTNSHVTFDGMATSLGLSGPGVGIYLQYVRGGFSTDLTTKFDFLRLNMDFAGLAPDNSISVVNAGLSGNAQYKFTGDNNNFIEPTIGFSLTHTGFGNGAATLGLEDAYTVRLQAGARVGTTWDLGKGITVDTNLKGLVYGNAIAQGTSVVSDPTLAAAIAPTDEGLVRGEIDPEVCFNLPNDFSVSLSGQVRFGQALIGGSAGVNVRKQF